MNLTTDISRKKLAWKMLIYLLVFQIFVAFVGRGVAPLGLLIGEDLVLTKFQIGLLPAALFLGQLVASLPAGYMTDQLGTRNMMLIIVVSLGGSFLLLSFSSFYVFILLLIFIGGVGYGAYHPASNRGIIYWFNGNNRGVAMGIKQTGVTAGSALAALILLPIANEIGWRLATLIASGAFTIVGLVIAYKYIDKERDTSEESQQSLKAFYIETLSMAKHIPLLLISISAMMLSGSQMILNTYIIIFAYESIGINLFLSGVLLVIAEVGGSIGRIAWGIISDRFLSGKRMVLLLIIAIIVASTSTIVALIPQGTSFFIMIPIVFVFGFSASGFNGIWMNVTTEIVPFKQAGIATGFSLMIGSIGMVIGPPLFGHIVDLTGYFSFGWFFILFMMIVALISLISSMILLRRSTRPT